MKEKISLKKALKQNFVPKKGFEKKESFSRDELEQAVFYPYFIPKKNAKVFKLKWKKLYRKSEAEELYTKTKLKKLGLKEDVINSKKPFKILESNYSSLKYPVFKIDQFKEDLLKLKQEKINKKHRLKPSLDLLILKDDDISVHYVGTLGYPFEYDYKKETILHFETKNIILTIKVPIALKQSCIGKDEEHILLSFQELIYQTKNLLLKFKEKKEKIRLRISISEDKYLAEIESKIKERLN